MSANEITLFAILIGFGIITGIVSGAVAVKKERDVGAALSRASLVGFVTPFIYCFVAGLFESLRSHGFSVAAAILSGLGMTVYVGCTMSFVSGLSSLLSSWMAYALSKKYKWCQPK